MISHPNDKCSLPNPPRERGGLGRGAVEGAGRRSACGGRVLAGQLRRDVRIVAGCLLRRLLVHLQPRFAPPGALQLILDVEREATEAVDLELDLVTVLERVEAAVVGAG